MFVEVDLPISRQADDIGLCLDESSSDVVAALQCYAARLKEAAECLEKLAAMSVPESNDLTISVTPESIILECSEELGNALVAARLARVVDNVFTDIDSWDDDDDDDDNNGYFLYYENDDN